MLFWILFYVSIVLVILKLYVKLTTGWCRSQVCLVGKTAIVTGANTGLGYETALDFAKRGARVILACRSESKAREATDKIIRETQNHNVLYKLVDFTSLRSVREFAKDIVATEERLDILMNNAGIYVGKDKKTEDGLLILMQANYFGPVLCTELLIDMLKKTSGRIVNVSSMAGKIFLKHDDLSDLNRFEKLTLYPRSKLCNILYTIELASRLTGTGVTTYSLHPGVVRTDGLRDLHPVRRIIQEFIFKLFCKNAIEGAQTQIYCAVADGIEKYSGEHFHDCKVVSRYPKAKDPQLVKRVWNDTRRILKLD